LRGKSEKAALAEQRKRNSLVHRMKGEGTTRETKDVNMTKLLTEIEHTSLLGLQMQVCFHEGPKAIEMLKN